MQLQVHDDDADKTIGVSAHDVAVAMQKMQWESAKAVQVTPQKAAAAGLECGDTAYEGCMTSAPTCMYVDIITEESK